MTHPDPPPDTAPLERINYINGQRLTRELLRKDQSFHIRLRRWLSKSLFTPGVADGLEVERVEGTDPLAIRVKPGLALDARGHAIVLVDETEPMKICGRFLSIRFDEEEVLEASDGCRVRKPNSTTEFTSTSWEGPTLIRKEPKFRWHNTIPADDKMQLVLAEFDFEDCNATSIAGGPRRFATSRQMAQIHTFALEGEKDIDKHNPKRLHFHVRGRKPAAVVLYIRAAPFSSLYYSELGQHQHEVRENSGTTTTASHVDQHSHDVTHAHVANVTSITAARWTDQKGGFGLTFDNDGTPSLHATWERHSTPHGLSLVGVSADTPDNGQAGPANLMDDSDTEPGTVGMNIEVQVSATSLTEGQGITSYTATHTHGVTTDEVETNATGAAAPTNDADPPTWPIIGTSEPLTTFGGSDGLYLSFDGLNITDAVREQIQANPEISAFVDWGPPGRGLPYAALASALGTGAIRVDTLTTEDNDLVNVGRGEHIIEFRIKDGTRTGGKIYYNLYVEAE